MAMPVSTEMRVTAPTTVSKTVYAVTQPEMGTFVPLFTVGMYVSCSIHISPQVILDDRFITMQNLSREQPYGVPTFMMESLRNHASTFDDHANLCTPYNAQSPSRSSIFGRNAPPALTRINDFPKAANG